MSDHGSKVKSGEDGQVDTMADGKDEKTSDSQPDAAGAQSAVAEVIIEEGEEPKDGTESKESHKSEVKKDAIDEKTLE